MGKLKLSAAVEKFKVGINKHNSRATESEIDYYIKNQIEIKTSKITELERSIHKNEDQAVLDYKAELCTFDDAKITTVKSREIYAAEYVKNAINAKRLIAAKKEAQLKEIDELKDEISDLTKLHHILSTIEIDVEE